MAELANPTSRDSESLDELLARARKGDESTLPRLRKILADQTRGSEGRWLTDHYGSPPAWLTTQLVENVAGKDLALGESIRAKMKRLRADLSGPDPTVLEKLLVERAVFCWFTLYSYEHRLASADSMNMSQGLYHQKKIDSAHKRFLSALSTLARVRKLALPNLLVAVGTNQQINVS